MAAHQDYQCANYKHKNIDGYNCPLTWREGRFDESGYEIDHIKELAVAGAHEVYNCQALCLSCHRVKTSRFLSKKK